MQKPVRYYITKSGDEPTVRSVAVALSVSERDSRPDGGAAAPEAPIAPRAADEHKSGVTSRVKGAIKKRSGRP